MVWFGEQLAALGWISDLFVAGSAATGDYRPGISDLDPVAIADSTVDRPRQAVLASLHGDLDRQWRRSQIDRDAVLPITDASADGGKLRGVRWPGRLDCRA
jgi:hypothetical protein